MKKGLRGGLWEPSEPPVGLLNVPHLFHLLSVLFFRAPLQSLYWDRLGWDRVGGWGGIEYDGI